MSGSEAGIVVIGAGQAGMQVCDSLRKEGFEGTITLIGDEPYAPYNRPPLSKDYLSGETARERLFFRPDAFYEKLEVTQIRGHAVTRIDRDAKTITLDDGTALPYTGVALTTGTRVRPLPVPGNDLDGVHYVRTLEDTDAIRTQWDAVTDLVIIGAGFIGLEVAAVAAKAGKKVTVLEMAPRVMGRVVAPEVSAFYENVHKGHGVDIRCATGVTELAGADGKVTGAVLDDGSTLPAQMVVVGIGVLPNMELAQDAGLACENGIIVDDRARTSDPAIVAAGDVAFHPNALFGTSFRLESVQNAIDQAKVAAATLAGNDTVYNAVPWFWSNQYDLRLQMAGISTGYDNIVIRGDMAEHKFSLFYFKGDKLLAVDSVNRPADHLAARKILAADGVIVPKDLAADPEIKLGSVLTG